MSAKEGGKKDKSATRGIRLFSRGKKKDVDGGGDESTRNAPSPRELADMTSIPRTSGGGGTEPHDDGLHISSDDDEATDISSKWGWVEVNVGNDTIPPPRAPKTQPAPAVTTPAAPPVAVVAVPILTAPVPIAPVAPAVPIAASATMADLPGEILTLIFSFLEPRDLARVSSVCRIFMELIAHPSLWRDIAHKMGMATRKDRNWRLVVAEATMAREGKLEAFREHQRKQMYRQSQVLTKSHARFLLQRIPLDATHDPQKAKLIRLYSSVTDGYSLTAFYSCVARQFDGPTLIVVKDTNEWVFGGYAPAQWVINSLNYYGDDRAFVFSLYPKLMVYPWNRASTIANYQYSDKTHIGLGGHVNFEALHLDDEFNTGRTFMTSTFRNPLLSKSEKFRCQVVEVFGIQPHLARSILRPDPRKKAGAQAAELSDEEAEGILNVATGADRMMIDFAMKNYDQLRNES